MADEIPKVEGAVKAAAYIEALGHPFRGENLGLTLTGGGVLAFCTLLVPFIFSFLGAIGGYLALLIGLVAFMMCLMYFQKTLLESAAGRSQLPMWGDEPLRGLLADVLGVVSPFFVSFLPMLVLRGIYMNFGSLGRSFFQTAMALVPLSVSIPYGEGAVPAWVDIVTWILIGLGLLYAPMAALVWTFFGSNQILLPWVILREAWRTGSQYLLMCALIVGVVVSAMGLSALVALPGIGWLSTVVSCVAFFAGGCLVMHLIGFHYRVHRRALQWEDEKRALPEA